MRSELQAEEHLKSAINIQPQEKSYIALSDFHLRQNQADKAIEILDRAKR